MIATRLQLRFWKIFYAVGAAGLIGCALVGVSWGSYEAMTWTVDYARVARWPIHPRIAGLAVFFVVLGAGLSASAPIVILAVGLLSRTNLIGGLKRLHAEDVDPDRRHK